VAKRVLSEEEIVKERLAYLGTMAGGLAHEVRSPLNSIHLNVELLERAGCHPSTPEQESKFFKRVGRVKEEVSSLQKILTEFLQFARPPRVKRLATDIRDFIYDVIEFIQPELEAGKVKVRFDVSDHEYPILIDRRQMEQVINNILFNARDAMDGGGTIIVGTYEEGHDIVINIEDEGPGIPSDEQDKIFDAFFTTKEMGTGLGLGICRRIVQEHGGRMQLKSPIKDGRGTSFSLFLPKEKLLSSSPMDTPV
jgi:two-component system, NtrC family, sensor histidine kinase HydH